VPFGQRLGCLPLQDEELVDVIEVRRFLVGEQIAGERPGVLLQREDGDRCRWLLSAKHLPYGFSVKLGTCPKIVQERALVLVRAQGERLGNAEWDFRFRIAHVIARVGKRHPPADGLLGEAGLD
jgi:hypothetical protein